MIEIHLSIPLRDEPVPIADIRDSFPSVLRVVESMAEENERNKNRDSESPDLIRPRLIKGLPTHFEQILPEEEEAIETRGPSLIENFPIIEKVLKDFEISSFSSLFEQQKLKMNLGN